MTRMSFCWRRVRSLEAGEGEAAMQVRAPRRRTWRVVVVVVVGRRKAEARRGRRKRGRRRVVVVVVVVVRMVEGEVDVMVWAQQAARALVLLWHVGGGGVGAALEMGFRELLLLPAGVGMCALGQSHLRAVEEENDARTVDVSSFVAFRRAALVHCITLRAPKGLQDVPRHLSLVSGRRGSSIGA